MIHALPMKYSFNIQAGDGKHEQIEKLVISAFNNESGSHIALKVIAYLMFIKRRPRIDEDAGWQVMPDLLARDDSGAITLWIDVARSQQKKLTQLPPRCETALNSMCFAELKEKWINSTNKSRTR